MNHDAHNYERRLEGQLRRIENDPSISRGNKKLIYEFKDYSFSDGISTGRVVRYMFDLRVIAQFLNESDIETCYSQGNYSVALAEPYCQPLTVYTIGQVNSTMSFTVDLRPSVPSGTYTIVRNIEIDPEQVWINYGREAIGTVEVKESNKEATISLKNTGNFPLADIVVGTMDTAETMAGDTITGHTVVNAPSPVTIISLVLSILTIGLLGYFYVSSKKRY